MKRRSKENAQSSDVIPISTHGSPITLTACSQAGSAIKASRKHLSSMAHATDAALSVDRDTDEQKSLAAIVS